jgi:outer membrane biosynthesis protein TonB
MNKEKVEKLGASFGVAVAEASVALVDIVKEALAGQSINLPIVAAPVAAASQELAAEEEPKKPARKRTTRAKKYEEEAPKAGAPEVMPLKPEAPKATPKKDEAPKAETPKAEVEVVAGDISISELRQIGTQLLTAATKAGQDGGAVLSEVVGTITLPNGTPAPNLSSVPVTEYATLKGRLEEAIAKYNADPLG